MFAPCPNGDHLSNSLDAAAHTNATADAGQEGVTLHAKVIDRDDEGVTVPTLFVDRRHPIARNAIEYRNSSPPGRQTLRLL